MGLSLQKNCHFFLNFLVSFSVCYKRRMDLTLMDKKGPFFNRAKLSSFVKSYIFLKRKLKDQNLFDHKLFSKLS